MRRLVPWHGRSAREISARRARHLRAQLGVAADIAITSERRALAARSTEDTGAGDGRGTGATSAPRGRVDVDDVLGYAHQHFGIGTAPRDRVASVLRARYELRGGRRDLDTDAYTEPYGASDAPGADGAPGSGSGS